MRVYARNTVAEKIDNDVAQSFVDANHKQGMSRAPKKMISVALKDKNNGDLLAVAQFCSPRTSRKKKEYTVELLRLCFKDDVRVIGGASKLIKFYISEYSPSDIFTYQDSTGENSAVYESAGFKFVKQEGVKKYLVVDGKTLLTADRKNNEVLSVSYAVKLGIDAILGTSIGEQFKDDGKRKTNIELFLENGYHLEETSGDKVYEWFNPEFSFYTYKITAIDSDKYYFGVRSLKVANATVEDCVNDSYMGSGGKHNKNNKFANWKKKHSENLVKDIVGVFYRRSEAYANEAELVGDRYKTDPLCLNSVAGGVINGIGYSLSGNVSLRVCSVHGEVKHIGNKCASCAAAKSVSVQDCVIHGRVKFVGDKCRSCISSAHVSLRECSIHGKVKHTGDKCYSCLNSSTVSMQECSVHGLVKHIGDSCATCAVSASVSVRECSIHGESKHMGDSCMLCVSAGNVSLRVCSVHGEVKHMGDKCSSCVAAKNVSVQDCVVHGRVKFIGDKCRSCVNDGNVSVRVCDVHGEVKHIGDKCYSCLNSASVTVQECSVHGASKFIGGKCRACVSAGTVSVRVCDVHGESKFVGGSCALCRSQSSVVFGVCDFHGRTKFRGSSCCQCVVDRTNHAKFHGERLRDKCSLCAEEVRLGLRERVLGLSESVRSCALCGVDFVPKASAQLFCSNPHVWECCGCGVEITPVPRRGRLFYACMKRDCKLRVRELSASAVGV